MASRKPLRARGLPGQVAVIFVVAISCLLIAVGLAAIIMPIIASVKVSNGEDYRYPLTIRMVS